MLCFSLIGVTIYGHLKGRILSLAGMIASPAQPFEIDATISEERSEGKGMSEKTGLSAEL